MPYKAIKDLPDSVKGSLPREAQKMFLAVVNSALEEYGGDDAKAFATAWAAIKRKWHKDRSGDWVAKRSKD